MLLKLTPLMAVLALSACGSIDRPFDPADTALVNPTPELGCRQLELVIGIRGEDCGKITIGQAALLLGADSDDERNYGYLREF